MTDVSLKEHLEHRIAALDIRIDRRLIEMDKALQMEAGEIRRRLGDLNHEQSRLAADRERYLQKEIFEEQRRSLDKWRDDVNAFIASNTGRDRGISLVWAVVLAIVGLSMSVAIFLKP